MADESSSPARPNAVVLFFKRIGEIQQGLLDRATPHTGPRWVGTALLFVFYFIRVYFLQGWYIVTYALGIYLLNLFIGFLTPKIDPALNLDSDGFLTPKIDPALNLDSDGFLTPKIDPALNLDSDGFLTPKIDPALNLDSDGFLTPKIDPALNLDSDEDGPELPMKTSDEFKPFMRRLPEFKFWYAGTMAVLVATFCTFFDAFNIPVFWPILVMYFFILFFITMKRQIKHMIKHRYVPWSRGRCAIRGRKILARLLCQNKDFYIQK